MRPALALAAAVLTFAAAPATAQDEGGGFDVMGAVNGVWAYDPLEIEEPGDFTCGDRPMAIRVIDGGARLAAMRPGEEIRYALVLDVRNDYPIGPALSVVWTDAPRDANDNAEASVLVMDSPDSFAWIEGPALSAYQSGARALNRSPRRQRCELAPVRSDDAAE
ncbi:MAG: hypothetical protein PVI23_08865 [Maricaulaceae bacterium]|jgi:hypothetical protein